MNKTLRKILEIIILVIIIGLTIALFMFRGEIGNVSDIGYLGLFVICFLSTSTIFLPIPCLILVAGCAKIMNPLWVILLASLGAALGELVGYVFGAMSKDLSPRLGKLVDTISSKVKSKELLVLIFAALPFPLFDAVGIYSGGVRMNLFKFFALCLVGKLIKITLYVMLYDVFVNMLSFLLSSLLSYVR